MVSPRSSRCTVTSLPTSATNSLTGVYGWLNCLFLFRLPLTLTMLSAHYQRRCCSMPVRIPTSSSSFTTTCATRSSTALNLERILVPKARPRPRPPQSRIRRYRLRTCWSARFSLDRKRPHCESTRRRGTTPKVLVLAVGTRSPGSGTRAT